MLGHISITILLQVLGEHQHSNHQTHKSLHHMHVVLDPAKYIDTILLKVFREDINLQSLKLSIDAPSSYCPSLC